MRIGRRAERVAAAGLALLLLATSCSGSDEPEATPTAPTDAGEPGTTDPGDPPAVTAPTTTAPTVPAGPPLFGAFDVDIELLTPASGGGARPTLEWTAVDGTDHYGVYLYAPDGAVYWAWRGHETSVPGGGFPQLADTSAGPSVVDGMTWAVVAYDADLLPIAVSTQAALAP